MAVAARETPSIPARRPDGEAPGGRSAARPAVGVGAGRGAPRGLGSRPWTRVRRSLDEVERRQAAFVALIRAALPETERVLCGWANIQAFLHGTLRLRRHSGQPLTRRQLRRWREHRGLPIAGGGAPVRTASGMRRTVCVTTTTFLTAWVLAHRIGHLFCIDYPRAARPDAPPEGS